MVEVSQETLVEIIDDAVSWMQAAKKENPKFLLPAWVSQWPEFRPTPRAADVCPGCGAPNATVINSIHEYLCEECGTRR